MRSPRSPVRTIRNCPARALAAIRGASTPISKTDSESCRLWTIRNNETLRWSKSGETGPRASDKYTSGPVAECAAHRLYIAAEQGRWYDSSR